MSDGVIEAIGRNADIDTRRELARAGFRVPIVRVTIPEGVRLPTWTHVLYPRLKVKHFQIDWYSSLGLSIFTNLRTRITCAMDTHSSMVVMTHRNGKMIFREHHPDYFKTCVCGCGYNTDRKHPRIRPRVLPPSLSKYKWTS